MRSHILFQKSRGELFPIVTSTLSDLHHRTHGLLCDLSNGYKRKKPLRLQPLNGFFARLWHLAKICCHTVVAVNDRKMPYSQKKATIFSPWNPCRIKENENTWKKFLRFFIIRATFAPSTTQQNEPRPKPRRPLRSLHLRYRHQGRRLRNQQPHSLR